ncbi:MAG: gluconokinase [Anaerolineales bacterium]
MPIVLMGVSGSGKTSLGRALAARLGWSFYDGDDFHSPQAIEKMSLGIPLNDRDRSPWLECLSKLISDKTRAGENLILACSALKKSYRQRLRSGNENLVFVFLDGSYDLIWDRMQTRGAHYMKAEMLQSQFDDLEVPQNALRVNIDRPIPEILDEIIEFIQSSSR